MKPPVFAYHAPRTLPEALELLGQHGDEAKVLAGGQSLVPLLNFRLIAPEHLVDINRVEGLDSVSHENGSWLLPALVRQRQVERSTELAGALPLLRQALVNVAHPQVRNRGTVCGSVAHADPAAELPTVMVALDASMEVRSHSASRTIAAEDFFQFHLTTVLEPEELLTAVRIPEQPPGTLSAFREFAIRRGDFALAAVSAVVTMAADGTVERCRLVAAGVAPTPRRLSLCEAAVQGSRLQDEVLGDAEEAARSEVSPTDDIHGDSEYRRRVVGVLARRALSDIRHQLEENDD
jgi:aerobic carbon-monoxide dehydrogenase medium subunit